MDRSPRQSCATTVRIVLLAASLAGCGVEPPMETGDDEAAAAQQRCDPAAYPCGPYGVVPGHTIADFALLGRRDDNGSGTAADDPARAIRMRDFFADRSLHALVLVVGGGMWCPPCRLAVDQIGPVAADYRRQGAAVAFLLVVQEDPMHLPADLAAADEFAAISSGMDVAADPTATTLRYLADDGFPGMVVVDTRDMRIVTHELGYDSGSIDRLRAAIDPLLR